MSVFIVFSPIPGFAVEATGSVRDCCRWRSMRRCGPSRSVNVREELMDICTNFWVGGGGARGLVVCRLFLLFLLRFVFLLVPFRFVFLEVHSFEVCVSVGSFEVCVFRSSFL